MITLNSGRQPGQKKSGSPQPINPNRDSLEYSKEQPFPITIQHARFLCSVLTTFRRKILSIAFTRIACRGDKIRSRKIGALLLNQMLNRKLQDYRKQFITVCLRRMLNVSLKSDLPDWFIKELTVMHAPQKLIEEADRQQTRIRRTTQKAILLQGISNLCRAKLQQRQTVQTKLCEFNNLSQQILDNQAGLKEINTWYRINVTKLSPQMRRLKTLLVKCQELTTNVTTNSSQRNRVPQRNPYPSPTQRSSNVSGQSSDFDDRSSELKQAIDAEMKIIIGLATNRKFSSLRTENERGKFPQLKQMVNVIVQLMQKYPQPGEMLAIEELATSINESTVKLQHIETIQLQKIQLSIDRFRKRLINSQNFLMRQVQTIVNYTDKLSAKLTTDPNEKLLLKQSMGNSINFIIAKTQLNLHKAKQQIQTLKQQFNRQRIQHQQQKVYQTAIYKEQVDQLKSQILQLQKQIANQNQRLDTLENAAADQQQNVSETRRPMMVTVWPKNSQDKGSVSIRQVHSVSGDQYIRKPPLLHTDSKTYYAPIEVKIPEDQTLNIKMTTSDKQDDNIVVNNQSEIPEQKQRLTQQLEDAKKQIERLNQVVAKYDQSFKSYQESTNQYRNMVDRLKDKLVEADKLDEQRAIEDLEKSKDEGTASRVTIQDLEAGRRIMELQTALSDARDRSNTLQDRLNTQINEMQIKISELQQEKYKIELRCERYENEFNRLAEQNREVSIVLSKRDSFGNHAMNIRTPNFNQINTHDSIFTFSQSADSPLPIITTPATFLRTRTLGGRTSDQGVPKSLETSNQINLQAESILSIKPQITNNQIQITPGGSPPFHSQAGNIKQQHQRSIDSQPNPNHPNITVSQIKDSSNGSSRPQLRKAESLQNPFSDYIMNPKSQQDSVQLAWCKNKFREYEIIIDKLNRQLEAKQGEIRQSMKQSSVKEFVMNPKDDHCLNCGELIYDLQSKIRDLELQCLKSNMLIERMQKDMNLMSRRLNHESIVQQKMVRQYKKKCLEVKNLMALTDTLCKQKAPLCRNIPNLEELKTRLSESDNYDEQQRPNEPIEMNHLAIINLVRAEDIQLPTQLTHDMRKICNIIMSAIVDLFNKHISKVNTKQLQRILQRYLIAMEKKKFKDALLQLISFIEEAINKLPDQFPSNDQPINKTQLSGASAKQIKQKFLQVVGWQNLLPAVKSYLSSNSSSSLAEIKQILRLQ